MSKPANLLIAMAVGLLMALVFGLGFLMKNPFWVVLPSDYNWQLGMLHCLQLCEGGFALGFFAAYAGLRKAQHFDS